MIQKLKEKKFLIAFLAIVHIAGLLGLIYAKELFLMLTPFNLILCAFLLLHYSGSFTKKLLIPLGVIAFSGWAIEVIGVRTGVIFGHYEYMHGLGLRLLEVPLLIGLNWAILCFSAVQLVRNHFQVTHPVVGALLASLYMTALDSIMEFVAPDLHFWTFYDAYAPLQNFVGWFLVGFILCLTFYKELSSVRNDVAPYYLFIQTVFFTLLYFFL